MPPKRNNKALCYAVARGRNPGIYFSWEEAEKQIHGFSSARFKSFKIIADSKAYLKSEGLTPNEPGFWLSTKKAPILYKESKKRKDGSRSSSVTSSLNQSVASMGPNPVISIDSSPESQASADDHRKRSRLDVISLDTDDDSPQKKGSLKEEKPKELKLDPIQQRAIDAAMEGKNVFITGVAGTGKSLVTQLIVKNAKAVKHEVAVAAPTGVAAVNLNLGAQTVHSLAGVKVPQRARDFGSIHSRVNAKKWRNIEVLVIDEVGMLTADFLDWLDVNVREVRRKPLEPFGGIQLIFVGDFAQLGPIPGSISLKDKAYAPSEEGADCFLNIKECTAYAFQSAMWREAKFHHVNLKKVYRQSDQDFIQALMHLRESKAESHLVEKLVRNCASPFEDRPDLEIPEGIRPTVLYCTNWKVDKENCDNLASLNTVAKRFEATDIVSVDSDVPVPVHQMVEGNLHKNKFFDQCQAGKNLDLKVGAQVMLLQNLSAKLVNGSRGVIEAFKLCPMVRDSKGEEKLIGPDDQDKYPGRRFDELKYGMTMEFEARAWKIFKFVKYPLVKFMNNESKIILPAPFERSLYRQGVCRRMQVPLRLAWALTIHKSQGSTLDLVICDLKGCFTTGQAYVALSRAKSMPGLQIRNFDPSCVSTDPLVESFYSALDRNKMEDFLEDEAGLWWFPILESPKWLDMFQNASNYRSRKNSEQFRQWLADYKPLKEYEGWTGFNDGKRRFIPSISTNVSTPSLKQTTIRSMAGSKCKPPLEAI